MIKSIIKTAKEIINNYNLEPYMDTLFEYWSQNPPTLGHGFAHVLTVAVRAYQLGEINNYPNPEHLFIGGLFHDIHRPAEGKDGEEDQAAGAEIVLKLFTENNVDVSLINKIISMIKSHDSWRNQDNPPLFDLLISLADKWSHDIYCFKSYTWSSNKYLKKHNQEIYNNYIKGFYTFIKYQVRAWEIFNKYKGLVKGTENGASSYLEVLKIDSENYLTDKFSEHYLERLEFYAKTYKQMELEVLKSFFNDNNKIDYILTDGSEL